MATLSEQDGKLFEKTLQLLKDLPELGVLLRVEDELPRLIREAYVGVVGHDLFAADAEERWRGAERRLRRALRDFATAANVSYRGRLFAGDALESLRIIDLC